MTTKTLATYTYHNGSLVCLHCGTHSTTPYDMDNRYCAGCDTYHEGPPEKDRPELDNRQHLGMRVHPAGKQA